MHGPRRPSEWRWLNGAIFGAPLLLLGLVLPLTGDSSEVLDDSYSPWGGLVAAAIACFVHSAYRAYRDFCKGDFDYDLDKWSGRLSHGPSKTTPRPRGRVNQSLRNEVLPPASIPAPDSQWATQISHELEAVLARHD